MSFPAYEEYKDSGVEWLGDVPEHWDVNNVRRIAVSVETGGTPSSRSPSMDEENASLWFTPADFSDDSIDLIDSTRKVANELIESGEAKQFPPDSVLIVSIGATLGKVGYCRTACWSNQQINAVVPNERIRGWFLAYSLSVKGDVMRYLSNASTIGIMNQEKTKEISLAIPPPDEQRTIASFLDTETSKIDGLVSEQRRLIELLKEKRQAVISHAVTKGLNPDVKMKPSGIQWLGDVPEHWEVIKLNLLTQIGNGSTPDRKNLDYWTDGRYPWLNSSVVNQSAVTESDQFVSQLALDECHLPKIEPPAVLVGITGQGRTRGMATILEMEATINQHVAYLKPLDDRTTVSFIHRFFQMAYDFIRDESEGAGSTKGAITCGQLEKLKMPLPPIGELTEITKHLNAETEALTQLEAQAERAIELLQERRTALISAAVTGKIDVRGYKPEESVA